jgi:hypothetical protein
MKSINYAPGSRRCRRPSVGISPSSPPPRMGSHRHWCLCLKLCQDPNARTSGTQTWLWRGRTRPGAPQLMSWDGVGAADCRRRTTQRRTSGQGLDSWWGRARPGDGAADGGRRASDGQSSGAARVAGAVGWASVVCGGGAGHVDKLVWSWRNVFGLSEVS